MKTSKKIAVASASILALTLTACSSSSSSSVSASPSATSSQTQVVKKIAFFGFWKSNSFTLAVLSGVQQAASAQGIQVADLSTPTYDAAGQIKAMQDQTVKGDAQMYITLASDSVGMATAASEAIAKGITVVAAFTPLGAKFDTLTPQVPGLVVVGETPVSNGVVLGELAAQACATRNPCNVAYLEGLKALPLDNARTTAFMSTLASKAPKAKIVADVEGGYAVASGQKAAQDALQAHPNVNVMVGSSQAIIGAQSVVDTTKVALIGNGSSKEAYTAVRSGKWFALYNSDIIAMGTKSVEIGLAQANGQKPNPVFNTQTLLDPHGTKDVIGTITGAYSDLG
jgi:ribose transport system substrate-binding protein